MKKSQAQVRLEEQYRKLKKQLMQVGVVCEGSLTRVFQKCGKPSCRCHRDKKYRHGPYYSWTRKVRGKTVSRTVGKEHVRECQTWIENNRRLNKIIRAMRDLTLRAAPWNQ